MKSLLGIIVISLIVSCTEEKIKPIVDNSEVKGSIPSHESWNSKITFTSDGKIKAVLHSEYLKKYDEERISLLEKIKIDFYNTDQEMKSELTANRGKVDDATQDMYAIENVVASNDSGTVLRTEELKWRNSDQKIVTDKFVKITSPNDIIEGYGFESDQHLNHYVIFNVTYSSSVKKGN
jgi:LPS export ABC transporter protein LptC